MPLATSAEVAVAVPATASAVDVAAVVEGSVPKVGSVEHPTAAAQQTRMTAPSGVRPANRGYERSIGRQC